MPESRFRLYDCRSARALVPAFIVAVAVACPTLAAAQVKAQARAGATPPWTKGIQPISSESYYHAIECGKRGGADPPCVFWDTGLCKNDDFTLAFYTPYKQVAYEVWLAVSKKQPVPTPNYQAAQRARVTVAATPVRGSKNVLTDVVLRRGGKPVPTTERSVNANGGRVGFTTEAFAPTAAVTLELVGRERTVSCVIEPTVLRQFR